MRIELCTQPTTTSTLEAARSPKPLSSSSSFFPSVLDRWEREEVLSINPQLLLQPHRGGKATTASIHPPPANVWHHGRPHKGREGGEEGKCSLLGSKSLVGRRGREALNPPPFYSWRAHCVLYGGKKERQSHMAELSKRKREEAFCVSFLSDKLKLTDASLFKMLCVCHFSILRPSRREESRKNSLSLCFFLSKQQENLRHVKDEKPCSSSSSCFLIQKPRQVKKDGVKMCRRRCAQGSGFPTTQSQR